MKIDYCILCMGPIEKKQTVYDFLKQDSLLCGVCKRQLNVLNKHIHYDELSLHIIYEYNDFLENMIFQFKEGHDVALKDVFFHDVIKEINDKFRLYTIALMPSSEEKVRERGFLPVKEMLSKCKVSIVEPFYKIENHKQSLQSFENRSYIEQVIRLKPDYIPDKRRILLVDDVCTSGATLKAAYHLLAKHRYKVEALVLCAHPLFVESCDKKDLKKQGRFSIL